MIKYGTYQIFINTVTGETVKIASLDEQPEGEEWVKKEEEVDVPETCRQVLP